MTQTTDLTMPMMLDCILANQIVLMEAASNACKLSDMKTPAMKARLSEAIDLTQKIIRRELCPKRRNLAKSPLEKGKLKLSEMLDD